MLAGQAGRARRATRACGEPFDVDPRLDQGDNWLGRPEGASSLTDLIGSTSKMVGEGGFRRKRKKRRERRERKGKSDVLGFSKSKFIVFFDFSKRISFCIF